MYVFKMIIKQNHMLTGLETLFEELVYLEINFYEPTTRNYWKIW